MKNLFTIVMPLVLAGSLCVQASAGEANWPTRAIELVVPANPGGDTDINCRVFLKYMEKELGQSLVVVNMAGAAGAVAMNNVMQARPDGYRAMFFHSGLIISKIMEFVDDLVTDAFQIAAMPVIDKSNCFVARADAPYNTPRELVEYVKANPNKVSYATETGSFTHLHVLALESLANVNFNIADAGTASEKITALLGGRVNVISTQYGLVKDYIKNGEFKSVGVLSDKRLEGAPDAETFLEDGYDLVFDKFFYVAFPKNTDKAIIEKFNAAAKKVAENPDYIAECQNNFVNANYFTTEESVQYINGQYDNYMKYEKALLGE